MTATMFERPGTARRSAPEVRRKIQRSETLTEQFEKRFEFRYPLFGTVARRRRIISMNHLGDVALWITQTIKSKVTPANMRHVIDVCAKQHPTWFSNLLFVRMEQQLHNLEPGIRLFVETKNFDQIPDANAPRCERNKYTEAIVREPSRSFSYLEPLWITAGNDRVGATVDDFIAFSRGQMMMLRNAIGIANRQALFNRADAIIEAIATAATLSVVVPAQFMFDVVVRMGRGTGHIYEGAKEFGRDLIRSSVAYVHPVGLRRADDATLPMMYVYDPFIVFGVPEMSRQFGDELPMALVADWE